MIAEVTETVLHKWIVVGNPNCGIKLLSTSSSKKQVELSNLLHLATILLHNSQLRKWSVGNYKMDSNACHV